MNKNYFGKGEKMVERNIDNILIKTVEECSIAKMNETVLVFSDGVVARCSDNNRVYLGKHIKLDSLQKMMLPIKYQEYWENEADEIEFDEERTDKIEFIETSVKLFFGIEE